MEQYYFTLEIISPTNTEVHSVEWVEIESPTGSFLVGPGHSQLISVIKQKSSVLYKKTNAEECSLNIQKGVFYVKNNKAVALVD
jgi:F0F1-type ATP synthase epsilon subunit